MIEMQRVKFEEIPHSWLSQAKKDHLNAKDGANHEWFLAVTVQGTYVGFAAVYRYGNGAKARPKSIWIDPNWRGQGFGGLFTDLLIRACFDDPHCTQADVLAYNPMFYEVRGWKRTGPTRPNGAVPLAKTA